MDNVRKQFSIAEIAASATGPFAKSWRLATQSLAEFEKPEAKGVVASQAHVWGRWDQVPGFPKGPQTTAVDRFMFLNDYLEQLLKPEKHPTHPTRMRPDLNGAKGARRAWLMEKILQRLLEAQKNNGRLQSPHGFLVSDGRSPEDLWKVAESMNLLRIHHEKLSKGPQRTLQHYKTFEELELAVAPFRDKYPMSREERLAAHRQFLRIDNSDGTPRYSGNGEAELLATLKDGTEVIHLKSKEAARAYGTPRMCTAYRHREGYFHLYSDNLLAIVGPQGERWQFHFRTRQFNDGDDKPIKNLSEFLKERPGLTKALTPVVRRAYNDIVAQRNGEEIGQFLYGIKNIRPWAETISAAKLNKALGALLTKSIYEMQSVPGSIVIEDEPQPVRNRGFAIGSIAPHLSKNIEIMLQVVAMKPEWQEPFMTSGGLQKALQSVTATERFALTAHLVEGILNADQKTNDRVGFRNAISSDTMTENLRQMALHNNGWEWVESTLYAIAPVNHWKDAALSLCREKMPVEFMQDVERTIGLPADFRSPSVPTVG